MLNVYFLEIRVKEIDVTLLLIIIRVENIKNSPYFKGPILRNSLPDDVILLPTLTEFKMNIKRLTFPFDDNGVSK